MILTTIRWMKTAIIKSSLFLGDQCSCLSWVTLAHAFTSPRMFYKHLFSIYYKFEINLIPTKLRPHEEGYFSNHKHWPKQTKKKTLTPTNKNDSIVFIWCMLKNFILSKHEPTVKYFSVLIIKNHKKTPQKTTWIIYDYRYSIFIGTHHDSTHEKDGYPTHLCLQVYLHQSRESPWSPRYDHWIYRKRRYNACPR